MAASIIHRASGVALSFAGLGILTWWLFALSSGADSYNFFSGFIACLTGRTFGQAETPVQWLMNILGVIIGVGLTWSFFQHLLTGIRHLVTDSGAAFELGINKTSAILTFIGGVLLTALVWFYFLGVAK